MIEWIILWITTYLYVLTYWIWNWIWKFYQSSKLTRESALYLTLLKYKSSPPHLSDSNVHTNNNVQTKPNELFCSVSEIINIHANTHENAKVHIKWPFAYTGHVHASINRKQTVHSADGCLVADRLNYSCLLCVLAVRGLCHLFTSRKGSY